MVSQDTLRSTPWFLATSAVLLLAIAFNLYAIRLNPKETIDFDKYSYFGSDFPPTIIPLSEHPYDSTLRFDDTVFYAPNSTVEWDSTFPSTSGFVRLGPKRHLYGISMFHQLHCLQQFSNAIAKRPTRQTEWDHVSHCMNYVRQMVLCASNLRLEPLKESPQGLKVDGLGLKHTCRDWTRLWDLAEENYKGWTKEERQDDDS
ncbi:hypothetical protein NLI96_g7905 [Meripilus lineatus]|uniref:Oxidase ustYa n=1 Tax=Meripilus lineatus TaxID=2056292 RepID=A0AAD5V3H0_9APHY|nr:hypothetical protein NLI96_g7905 [Physisporinus lineatus]